MQIRKSTGIHARSRVDIHKARPGLYAGTIDGQVAVKLGPDSWSPRCRLSSRPRWGGVCGLDTEPLSVGAVTE